MKIVRYGSFRGESIYVLLLTLSYLYFCHHAGADSGTWTNRAGGTWGTAGNWAGSVIAYGANNTADLSTLNITASTTVTLDTDRTIGVLKFADTTSSHDWTLQAADGSILTLSSSSAPEIFVSNRTANLNLVLAGNEGFTKSGAGTLTLAATNTYSGVTTVTGGTVIVKNNLALGSSSGITIYSNNILRLNEGITVSGIPATIFFRGGNNGVIQSSTGTATWAGSIILGDDRARLGTTVASATLIVNGSISDAGNMLGLAVRCAGGAGTVLLNSQCTYSGVTEVVVGNLCIGDHERISPKSSLLIGNGSNIDRARFDLNGYNQTFAGLTTLGSTMEAMVTNSSPTLSTLNVSNDTSFSYGVSGVNGIIAGNVALVKTGPGTQTLANANFYTGSTIVSQGVLNVSGNGSIAASTNITIESGAQLVIEAATADALGNTADLVLKSGVPNGRIYLTNGAYDVVGKLFFDGTEKSAGTWGSSVSGAANTNDDFFEGKGLIAVGMPVNEGSWSVDSNGNWSVVSNWTNNIIASGPGKTAYFTNTITGSRTVTQDFTAVCIGSIFFDAPGSYGWSIVSNTIDLAGSTPTISVATNTAVISSAVNAPAGIVKSGSGVLILDSTNTSLEDTTICQGTLIITNNENALLPEATLTLGDSANVTNAGTLNMSGLNLSAYAIATTTKTNSNALYTNKIHNLTSGKSISLSMTDSNNIVFINEGTHLEISGGGNMSVNATNGDILIMGRRDAVPEQGLDLFQMGSFTAVVNAIYVGYDKNNVGRKGLLALASGNNDITAGSIYAGFATSAGGVTGQILLGSSNDLKMSNLYLGHSKASGTLTFNPALSNPHLQIVGTNGMRANVYLGTFNVANSGTQPTGNLMITNAGSSIEVEVNEMVLGSLETYSSSATAGGYGNFTFNGGTVDVNTVILGRNLGATRGRGQGILTMNGGIMNVNSNFTLGQGTVTTGTTYGAFILNGGTANIFTNPSSLITSFLAVLTSVPSLGIFESNSKPIDFLVSLLAGI